MINTANVVKRYFAGQVMYWTGFGWSNVSARAERFDTYFDALCALTALETKFDGAEADSIICGSNMTRVFRRAR